MEPHRGECTAEVPGPEVLGPEALRPCAELQLATEQDGFLTHRPMLHAIAYRMLGSVQDAEDVVQDAYIRWAAQDQSAIENPAAFLTTVATRLCLDRLRSASVRREIYVGPWLPEPLPTGSAEPDAALVLRDSASIGMLLLFDRLSPAERAVFVLREAFDLPYQQIAEIIEHSPDSCRQLHHRARQRVASSPKRPRSATRAADPARDARIVEGFLAAAQSGDLDRLKALFHEDVVVLTDGGGKVSAARNPIHGAEHAARLYAKVFPERLLGSEFTVTSYNYTAALLVRRPTLLLAYIFETDDAGLITNLYMVANPDKTGHLRAFDASER